MGGSSRHQLSLFVYEYDAWRQHLLQERGFAKTEEWGVIRRLRFGQKVLPPVQMPAGYTLRSARADDEGEHQLQALGATVVTVATGDILPANRLYESVGSPEIYRGYTWRKVW